VTRIEEKVSSLLKLRNSGLIDLRRLLGEHQEMNAQLETQLDEMRDKKVSAAGNRVIGDEGVVAARTPSSQRGPRSILSAEGKNKK
jgi:hypothetical protein